MSREVKILTIDEKAIELGKMISVSDEFQAMRQAESALRGDTDGFKMVEEFQMLQRNLDQMQRSGQQLTEDNMRELQETEEKAMQNSNVKGFFDANMRFFQLLEHVNAKVQEGISGRKADNCGT